MALDPTGEWFWFLLAGAGTGTGVSRGTITAISQWSLLAVLSANLVSSSENGQECETCAKKYPNYKKCSELSGYVFNSKQAALQSFGGSNYRLHNPSQATRGPCVGTDGAGMHWNVRSGKYRVGSITSCTCCQESGSGPVLKTKYKAIWWAKSRAKNWVCYF